MQLTGVLFRVHPRPLIPVGGTVVDGESGAPLAGEVDLRLADGISGFGVPRHS